MENKELQLEDLAVMIKGGFDEVHEEIAELKSDVAELKSDVAELKSDVAELKSDVAELKSDVAELKVGYLNLKDDYHEIVARLDKADKERREMREILDIMVEAIENIKERLAAIEEVFNDQNYNPKVLRQEIDTLKNQVGLLEKRCG